MAPISESEFEVETLYLTAGIIIYRTQVYLGSDLWVPMSLSERGLSNLTDVTLADQATNSIQADNANMAIQGNVAMKVTQSSGQLWNQCKRRHPLTKF